MKTQKPVQEASGSTVRDSQEVEKARCLSADKWVHKMGHHCTME